MKKNKSVGQLLKEKRLELECSQEAVATEIGVSIKFISLVENGERQLSVNHFPKVANFLGIEIKDLFNSKLYDEKSQSEMRRIKRELSESMNDQVGNAIRLNNAKEFRVKEIDELIRFLEMSREDYSAQIKINTINKTKVENQIKLLNEEKEVLGFGQLQMEVR